MRRPLLSRVRVPSLVVTFFVLLAIYSAHEALSNQAGIFSRATIGCGSPAEGTGNCHSTSATSSTTVHLWTTATSFVAGAVDTFHISVSNPLKSQKAAGFNVSVDTVNGVCQELHPGGGSPNIVRQGQKGLPEHNQLTHFFTTTFGSGTDSSVWYFVDTLPQVPGVYHIYASGNAVNANGTHDAGDLWNMTSMTINVAASGVATQEKQANNIRVFPNPSSGRIHFSSSEPIGGKQIEVMDASGRIVYRTIVASGSSSIDLSGLANGAYLVRIAQATGDVIKPISIQH